MSKFNQSLDLRYRQRRKTLAQFFERLPEVEAIHNCIRQNPRTANYRAPETFPGTVAISSQAIQSISEFAATLATLLPYVLPI